MISTTDENTIHSKPIYINFGKKDKDLWEWVGSIPEGRFGFIIKDIIRAYTNQDITYQIPIYPKQKSKIVRKSIHVGKRDMDIVNVIIEYQKEGKMISYEVKQMIRYFLNNGDSKSVPTPKKNTVQQTFNPKKILSKQEENIIKINNAKNKQKQAINQIKALARRG